MRNTDKKILLIVDDESSVCRALARMLGKNVDEVHFAGTPREANIILNNIHITHLICDHMLGLGQPMGLTLAVEWKNKYLFLKKIIILTGTDVANTKDTMGLDGILPKTATPAELREVLDLV